MGNSTGSLEDYDSVGPFSRPQTKRIKAACRQSKPLRKGDLVVLDVGERRFESVAKITALAADGRATLDFLKGERTGETRTFKLDARTTFRLSEALAAAPRPARRASYRQPAGLHVGSAVRLHIGTRSEFPGVVVKDHGNGTFDVETNGWQGKRTSLEVPLGADALEAAVRAIPDRSEYSRSLDARVDAAVAAKGRELHAAALG